MRYTVPAASELAQDRGHGLWRACVQGGRVWHDTLVADLHMVV